MIAFRFVTAMDRPWTTMTMNKKGRAEVLEAFMGNSRGIIYSDIIHQSFTTSLHLINSCRKRLNFVSL